jgi:hypothetical protein
MKNEKRKMQNYNSKLKIERKSFELWFFAFLPVRCLTASILALPVRYTQTGQAGTQTDSFHFLA